MAAAVLLIASSVPAILFMRNNELTGMMRLIPPTIPSTIVLDVSVALLVWVFVMSDSRLRLPSAWVCVTLVAVIALTVAWYVNYEPTWGPGSDTADALKPGVTQLLRGADPYAVVTKLRNPLSPMLGGFLLALPFVLAFGNLYLQGVLWMIGGLTGIVQGFGVREGCAAAAILAFSTWTRLAMPTQSDTWITAAGVVAAGSLGLAVATGSKRGAGWR